MSRLRSTWLAAAAVISIVIIVNVTNPHSTLAQTPPPTVPVKVTNTPLPVASQGTTTVAGAVQAQQSGSWSVGPTAGTTVGLAPGTSIGVDLTGTSVNVGNSATNPVLVRDVDGLRDSAAITQSVNFNPGQQEAVLVGLVPGFLQRFVVEHVSAQFALPPDQAIVSATISGSVFSTQQAGLLFQIADFLAPAPLGVDGGVRIFVANHQTKLYLEASQPSSFTVRRFPFDGAGSARLSLFGYLVPSR